MAVEAHLFLGNDTSVELIGLNRSDTDAYVNDATVTFTLKDSNGTAVTGAENISMSYVSSSNGQYRGTLQDTVTLTNGGTYYLEVTATGAGFKGFWRFECLARYRGANE